MRLNNDWLNIINAPFGQIDTFKLYSGALPTAVGVPPVAEITAITFNMADTFSFSAQTANGFFISMSDDQSRMYVLAFTPMMVYSYTLVTPGDVTTAVYDSKSFAIPTASPVGLSFANGGTRMYTTDDGIDGIQQYDLSVAWDITTAVASKTLAVGTLLTIPTPQIVHFSGDGTTAYVIDWANAIFELTLSIAWEIDTGTATGASLSVSAMSGAYFWFTADGKSVYVVANSGNLQKFSGAVAYDIANFTIDTAPPQTLANEVATSAAWMDTTTGDIFALAANAVYKLTGTVTAAVNDLLADLSSDFTADINNTFLPVTDGVGTKMVWQGATVIGSATVAGDMAFFTMECSNGVTTFLVDGTVTATGGGGDVEFASIAVVNGTQLAIDGINFVFNDVFNT